MGNKFFITGTDTAIGKTYSSVGLLKAFNSLGHSTLGVKPIASGCVRRGPHFYNDDALALQQASSIQLEYQHINPFAFEPAIAPHLAAGHVGVPLSADAVITAASVALDYPADVHIIEGVGGWHVPLNDHETMADFVIRSKLSVIVVVGIRLGCLNHAILTYQAIQHTQLPLAGWIANCLQPNETASSEMIATLTQWIKARCLGVVGYGKKPEQVLDVSLLMGLFSSTLFSA